MPGLIPILDEPRDEDPGGESLKLFLPSDLSAEDRAAWCPPDIITLEFRFRYAQCDDSLAELRHFCRLFQGLQHQKTKHFSHVQRNVTRSQGLEDGFRSKIRRCASRYSHARDAMLALDPDQKFSPGWTQRFKKLNEKDIRGPGRELDQPSEGQFILSWIWLVPRSTPPPSATTPSSDPIATTSTPELTTPDADELAGYMRAHWAKCQARAERYEEEVALTVEEMGRTLRYFEWKQSWWLSLESARSGSQKPPPEVVQRGLEAYAHRQANIYRTLVTSFANRWRKTLISHKLNPSWLSRYPTVADPLSPQPQHVHPQQGAKLVVESIDPVTSHAGLNPPSPSLSQNHGDNARAPLADDGEMGNDGDTDAPLANDVESGNDGNGDHYYYRDDDDYDDDDDDDDEYVVDEVGVFDAED